MIEDQLRRLFSACERGKDDARFEIYADALSAFDEATVAKAVDTIVLRWDKSSVPPLGVITQEVHRVQGTNPQDPEREKRALQEQIRYHLERYADLDGHAFRDTFGVLPTEAIYAELGIEVPEGVTFRTPPRAVCERERARLWNEVREAMEMAFDAVREQ